MKAEQRKELERNTLVHSVRQVGDSLRNRPSNGVLIACGVALLAALGFFIYNYFASKSTKDASAQWVKLDEINDVAGLEKYVGEYRGTSAARTARFEEARYRLEHGVQNLGNKDQRASAIDNLKQARKLYEELAPEARDTPVLVQEALMGKAKAEEALAGTGQGTLDKAIALYEKLAQDPTFKDSFQGKAAAARAKLLRDKKKEMEEFYAKLNEAAK